MYIVFALVTFALSMLVGFVAYKIGVNAGVDAAKQADLAYRKHLQEEEDRIEKERLEAMSVVPPPFDQESVISESDLVVLMKKYLPE